jgi:transcriptional regulator GlxA family with amidase domain
MDRINMKTIAIVVFDKFTDIDIFLPWDLFNRIRFVRKDTVIKFVGTQAYHRSINGIDLKMHGMIEECKDADIVFFGSGAGTRALYQDKEYLSRFQLDPERQIICSMCSGALLLAGLGLLDQITATTYPSVKDLLKDMGVEVVDDQHLVTHGNIATAAGCLAAVDLLKWCIDKVFGPEVADDVIKSVLPVGQGLECRY